jgi:hypothetical protein
MIDRELCVYIQSCKKSVNSHGFKPKRTAKPARRGEGEARAVQGAGAVLKAGRWAQCGLGSGRARRAPRRE